MVERQEIDKFIDDNYHKLLALVVKRYRLDEDNARDVLHDALIKVIEHHAELEQRKVWGWLSKVIYTTYIDWLRKERRKQAREVRLEDVAYDTLAEEGEELLDQVELSNLVRSLLRLLPEEDRELVEWRYFEGIGVSQLAQRLSTNEGTVKSRLGRALERLRAILGAKK